MPDIQVLADMKAGNLDVLAPKTDSTWPRWHSARWIACAIGMAAGALAIPGDHHAIPACPHAAAAADQREGSRVLRRDEEVVVVASGGMP